MFPNYAGSASADMDAAIADELKQAGIEVHTLPGPAKGEVKTVIIGSLHKWYFGRAWRYWVCDGPGIEVETAERLHKEFGRVVRVGGHCGCPSPREWFGGLACGIYHVDSQEGLNALAATIRGLVVS